MQFQYTQQLQFNLLKLHRLKNNIGKQTAHDCLFKLTDLIIKSQNN